MFGVQIFEWITIHGSPKDYGGRRRTVYVFSSHWFLTNTPYWICLKYRDIFVPFSTCNDNKTVQKCVVACHLFGLDKNAFRHVEFKLPTTTRNSNICHLCWNQRCGLSLITHFMAQPFGLQESRDVYVIFGLDGALLADEPN